MASRKIVAYRASWHPSHNSGVIDIDIEPGGRTKWTGKSAAEFTAILSILSSADDPFLTSNGWISTGVDDPDG